MTPPGVGENQSEQAPLRISGLTVAQQRRPPAAKINEFAKRQCQESTVTAPSIARGRGNGLVAAATAVEVTTHSHPAWEPNCGKSSQSEFDSASCNTLRRRG
jgi:hypothetical protein